MRQRLSDAGIAVIDTELNYDKIVETGEPELDTLARKIRRTIRVNALHVDHRKIVTIDGCVAYCGSANFGAQYQYRVSFDPAKDARDEATAARQRGQPEPWWKWHAGTANGMERPGADFGRASALCAPKMPRAAESVYAPLRPPLDCAFGGAGLSVSFGWSPMTVFRRQNEKAGHFLQPTARATGQRVMLCSLVPGQATP